jgi:hypothetical protein
MLMLMLVTMLLQFCQCLQRGVPIGAIKFSRRRVPVAQVQQQQQQQQ